MLAFQGFLVFLVLGSVDFIVSAVAQEGTSSTYVASPDTGSILALSAAIAVGLSVLGAAMAIKTTGTAAISALSENEGAFFKAFLVVALGEALAVYGLIVAILIWTKIPTI
jgi:V/A-type H+-transporting ATPase subunit K